MKVKVFQATSNRVEVEKTVMSLEKAIQLWLDQNPNIKILSVTQSSCCYGYSISQTNFATVMFVYQEN